MEIINYLKDKAAKNKKTIVFPEGHNPSILRAATSLLEDSLLNPILVGSRERIQEILSEQKIFNTGICIVDPMEEEMLSKYISVYCEERQMPEAVGRRIFSQPLYFSAMMVKMGSAQGMVGGIDHPTEEIIMASELIIGISEGVSVPSSFYLVEIPGFKGSQENLMMFSDPSMNPDPSAMDLADIAFSTAQSARTLLDWDPKVALLSFSTKGSADHPLVKKIQTAYEYLGQKNCDFTFDGELQADTAIDPVIGRKKTNGASPVAGKANILIFPDLNSCNISSKLVQQLTGARFYGPILQGFQFPVSDLSRGATVEDIIGSSLLIAASK